MAKKIGDIFEITNPLTIKEEPSSVLPAVQVNRQDVISGNRTIDVITTEIIYYKGQTVQSIIEIGKRLVEAKAMLQHGEWLEWLGKAVEFSESTAQRFMKIANEFSNTSAMTYLPYTKLITLLRLPEEERDSFIADTHMVDGEAKTVDSMTTRQLERAIKERNEAQKDGEQSQKEKNEAENKAEEYKQKFVEEQEKNKKLNRQLKAFEDKPVDVAVRQLSEQEIEQIKQEAYKKALQEVAKKNVSDANSRGNGERIFPPEVAENADINFCATLKTSLSGFMGFLVDVPVNELEGKIQSCIKACQEALDKLYELRQKSKNLQNAQLGNDNGEELVFDDE